MVMRNCPAVIRTEDTNGCIYILHLNIKIAHLLLSLNHNNYCLFAVHHHRQRNFKNVNEMGSVWGWLNVLFARKEIGLTGRIEEKDGFAVNGGWWLMVRNYFVFVVCEKRVFTEGSLLWLILMILHGRGFLHLDDKGDSGHKTWHRIKSIKESREKD